MAGQITHFTKRLTVFIYLNMRDWRCELHAFSVPLMPYGTMEAVADEVAHRCELCITASTVIQGAPLGSFVKGWWEDYAKTTD